MCCYRDVIVRMFKYYVIYFVCKLIFFIESVAHNRFVPQINIITLVATVATLLNTSYKFIKNGK